MASNDLNGRELRGGIDLGGTKIQAIVIDQEHRVVASARRPTPTRGDARDVLNALGATLDDATREAGIATRSLAGVGLGTPGAVDARRGTVVNAGNLPGFGEVVPLAAMLESATGVNVQLGNDVGVALDAEARLGIGREFPSFVGVWWGTGVGGGVVLDGQRWLGRGAAGEIGHTVVVRDGAICPCGRRGCLEAYAGRRAMELRVRKLAERGVSTILFEVMEKRQRDRLTSGVWARALEKRDRLALRTIERAIAALGAACASSVNLLDVGAIVIGGGLGTRLGAPYAQLIAEAMQPHLFRPQSPPAVRVAELGDLAGAIGASLLAFDVARAAR
jgi:glucokinase